MSDREFDDIADVEVDDETGVVRVLKLFNVYEVGRAIRYPAARLAPPGRTGRDRTCLRPRGARRL